MCTLCVKIKIVKIIFGTSLCYNSQRSATKKLWVIEMVLPKLGDTRMVMAQ